MSFRLFERESRGVAILDLAGKLTVGSADQFRDGIKGLLERDRLNIVLNLEQVTFLDSTGLGALQQAAGAVRQRNGQLKLVGLTARVENMMAIAKLLTSFDTFDSENDAIDSILHMSV